MKNIAPYQESNNARKELKELLQFIGFTIHHCSLRETYYSEEETELFLSKSNICKNNFMLWDY